MIEFTWDKGPIAVPIPKEPMLMVVGAIAALMLIIGVVKKQTDLSVFGLFMGAILALASNFLPDPIGLRWYSLLFVGVFLGGYALLNWQIQRGGGDEETAGDFIVYGVLGVLVGSRLGHVLFYDLDKAIDDPLWVLQIWTGGLASHGATLGICFSMWLFTKRRGISVIEGYDRFAFSAALGATLVRLGNFLNSEILGRPTPNQDWGVRFTFLEGPNAPLRHPSQLYEVGLGLFVMLVLFIADRMAGREKRPRGLLVSMFFLVYFSGRFIVENFKAYQTLSEESSMLTMGQVLSLPGIFIGIVGLIATFKIKAPAGWVPLKGTAAARAAAAAAAEDEADEADEEDDAEENENFDPDVDEALHEEDDSDDEEKPALSEEAKPN